LRLQLPGEFLVGGIDVAEQPLVQRAHGHHHVRLVESRRKAPCILHQLEVRLRVRYTFFDDTAVHQRLFRGEMKLRERD